VTNEIVSPTSARPVVACVTCAAYPELYQEDRVLLEAFAEHDFDARSAIWDDPTVDWSAFDVVLVRSPWDAHARTAQFLAWYESVSRQTTIFNSLHAVQGNQHKGYLCALGERGAPVIPTVVVRAPSEAAHVAFEHGWDKAVVKPATAMGGSGVYLVSEVDTVALDSASTGDWVVQPYLPSITDEGEISLIYIGGRASHAVQKWPKAGEIRVHESHGGSHALRPLDAELIAVGDRIVRLAEVGHELVARVDLIRDDDGRLLLCELELTSPRLFFGHCPAAVDELVEEVVKRSAHRRAQQQSLPCTE